jgi:hypothetical protein
MLTTVNANVDVALQTFVYCVIVIVAYAHFCTVTAYVPVGRSYKAIVPGTCDLFLNLMMTSQYDVMFSLDFIHSSTRLTR